MCRMSEGLVPGARAAAGRGVRQIRAETHRKESSPRKVLYCWCRVQRLLRSRADPVCTGAPSIVTVSFPRVSGWGWIGGLLLASVHRGQAAPRDQGTQLLLQWTRHSEGSSRLDWGW